MLFHTTSKREYDGQDFKIEFEATHGHPKKTFTIISRDKYKLIR